MAGRETSRTWALALLCVTQLAISLDLASVNLSLPSIQDDLDVSQANLKWVASAYAVALGGFVLLGGRAADLLGRRRMLMAGLAVFGLGSLGAGLAWGEAALIGARGLQGVGAAIVTPAALSLLAATFPEGRERTVALGAWSAAGGLGGVAGLLLGGMLAGSVGWEWAFVVNLPVVVGAIALAPLLLDESRDGSGRRFDALGAVLVTAGLSSAVVTVSRAATIGWTSTATLGSAALSLAVLGAFVLVELRSDDPLVRLSILRRPAVRAANVGAMLVTAAVAPMLLLLTLYLQQVLGLSPLRAGLAYVTIAATTTLCSALASRLVSRLGPKPVLATGLALLAVGLGSFSRAPMDGSYLRDLLPGFVVVAIGMAFSFVSVNAAVLSGVDARDAGLGSGLVGTSQSVGAGLGLALLSSIATAHADAAERAGAPASVALNGGLQAAFGVGALVALVGVAVVVLVFRRESEDARSADASGVATAAAPA
jgi:EmrB/QacA subfamily drug resistance transporter